MALNQLTDLQLQNLFTVISRGTMLERGKAILMELLIRGYVYDVRREQFLTAEQWTQRYGEKSPKEYFADVYENLRQKSPHARSGMTPS